MVESRLVRTAWAALSSMVIHSEAGTTKTGRCVAAEVLAKEGTQDVLGAGEVDPDVVMAAARMAPRISGSGALSEPIASTTMSIGIRAR